MVELTVGFGKQSTRVHLPAGATLQQLGDELAAAYGVAPATIKLMRIGGGGGGGGSMIKLQEQADQTLEEAGIAPGARFKMLASRPADVEAVQGQREDSRVPGFDTELRRQLRRAGVADGDGGSGAKQALPSGPYTFQRFEAWQRPGLTPPPAEALKLLHRLAADPGIVGVMNKHKWAVGLLSEMPPEGKVGVSPVCILGVNINRGQEVSLRLRTDDLKGFRRYDRIRETLLHELAHMVWGEHDTNFKQLKSQLRRECDAFDWRGPAARSLAGAAFQGTLKYELPPERQTVMQQTAASSGATLRQLAAGGAGVPPEEVPADARQAAAAAALKRAGGAEPGPSSTQQQAEHTYRKGQAVLYRQRDGSLQQAKVVAVDPSVQPPSYGIEIDGGYRETEAARLAPLPPQAEAEQEEQQEAVAVEGLGHRDAATEAKEAAARQLEE